MQKTKELIKEFENFWEIALNGDYRNGYKLSSLAKAIVAEAAKPEFNKNQLSLTEQISLQHALILTNIEL